MPTVDIWFTRHNGHTYMVTALHGEEPTIRARRLKEGDKARDVVRRLGRKLNVVQVGILPAEMMGILF